MKPTERLYLSKKEGNHVYVDICDLPQHQIDGIRFIYRQFKKDMTGGIIINDPPGYGKIVQVVLFLNAIHSVLKKSILILCDKEKVHKWRTHLEEWTTFNDNEIFIEPTYHNINKKYIYINSISNIARFAKSWNIAIIDCDNLKDVIKMVLNSTFKIWITSEDLKKNLKTFSKIYKWLKPKEEFNEKEFIPEENDLKDLVSKTILLDAFMKDVLIRRSDFTPQFITQNILNESRNKASRKNKDLTGTKIKRSKKTAESESNGVNINNHKNNREFQIGLESDDSIGSNVRITEPNLSENSTICAKASNDSREFNKPSTSLEIVSVYENIKIENKLDCDGNNELNLNGDNENSGSNVTVTADHENNYSNVTADNKNNELNLSVNNENKELNLNDVTKHGLNENKKIKSTDEILKEMEEKALKKFKGSLLDNLF